MIKGNAIIGQSGGPTSAINATLAGILHSAENSSHIVEVFGMRNGIEMCIRDRKGKKSVIILIKTLISSILCSFCSRFPLIGSLRIKTIKLLLI